MPDPADMAEAKGGQLWFIASLPPPVNGQANCNAAMLSLLSKTSRPYALGLGRSSFSKILRALANCWALLRKARTGDAVYVSIPGQQGAWLLLPAVIMARLRGLPIWFHHHSFRSINLGPMAVMRALVTGAGPNQQHILLSDSMRDRFASLYLRDGIKRARALSNTVLFPSNTLRDLPPRKERPLTLGHLSVLTLQKGVLYLIEMFEELSHRIPGIRLVIAGPSSDAAVLTALQAAQARYADRFEYRGEVGGADKEQFFYDIDLFVLPTTLVDEAEPLVLIEAYSYGVDVFATATGCIPDRIRDTDLILSLNRSDDVALISTVARTTSADWEERRVACRAHVSEIQAKCTEEGRNVLAQICDSAQPFQYTLVNPADVTKAGLP